MNYYNMEKNNYFGILKQLHDVCRNNPAPTLTCMDAYNEIINYLYLRHLSDNNGSTSNDKNNLEYYYNQYCQDEHIEEDNNNEIFNKTNLSGEKKNIFYEKLSQEFLPRLLNHNENQNIGFVQIMGEKISELKVDIGRLTFLIHQESGVSQLDGGKKAQKIINKIYSENFLPLDTNNKFNLTLFPYDAMGEGFEKFMSEGGSSGGNWGQYFTNPQVIDYIINKININKKHKVIDPFAGSGGFLLQAKYKFNLPGKNIYGRDFDDKLFKFLRFNSQVAKLKNDNITKGDSFDYYDFIQDNIGKYDRIIANPPFGVSVDIILANNDLKNFWGIMKTGKATIKDSMGLSVYLMYKLLNKDGIAGFVTDRGILNNGTENNSWQKKLRKEIITKCNISEILLLPKGIFSHTNFDTAVVIMQKSGETKEIKFHQGYFDNQDKGKGNKKMHIKENILTISFKDIVSKDWSLKYDDYIEKEDISYEGIEYKNILDICRYDKSKRKAGDTLDNGKYKFFTSSSKIKYSNYNDFDGEYIIMGNGGKGSCHYINEKFSCSADNYIFYSDNNYNMRYLYYFLKISFNQIEKLFKGQGLKHLTLEGLKKLKIPILSPDHQERIVEFMDNIIGDNYSLLDNIVSKFKDYDLFKILINEDYDGFKKLFEYHDDLVSLEKHLDKFSNEYKTNKLRACFKTVKSEVKTLGEVCEYKYGTRITKSKNEVKSDFNGEKYPVYGGGGITFYTDDFNCNENTLVIGRFGVSPKCVRIVSSKFFLNDSGMYIQKYNINEKYLNLFLLVNQNNIYNKYASGQAQKNMETVKLFREFKIPVPSLEDQEKVVKMIKEIEKEDSEYNKMLQSIKDMIQMIYDSIKSITDISDNNQGNSNSTEGETSEDESDESYVSEEEEDNHIITHKGKEYYLEDDIVYRYKNDKKGKRYGTYKKGKVKKDKGQNNIDV